MVDVEPAVGFGKHGSKEPDSILSPRAAVCKHLLGQPRQHGQQNGRQDGMDLQHFLLGLTSLHSLILLNEQIDTVLCDTEMLSAVGRKVSAAAANIMLIIRIFAVHIDNYITSTASTFAMRNPALFCSSLPVAAPSTASTKNFCKGRRMPLSALLSRSAANL